METAEKEFEDFFNCCAKEGFTSDQMLQICKPLIWHQRVRAGKKLVAITLALLAVYFLINWCDSCAWFLSALGRLALIQLLQYWDWTTLYNAKCLIEWPQQPVSSNTPPPLGKYETDPSNCVLCESLERIPTASNVTFSFLEDSFLESGTPVIVTDSHKAKSLQDLLDVMLHEAPHFLDSEPCDVATNLMLRKLFKIDLALQKIQTMAAADRWFLQLRNCQFKAVKASRAFVTRPYYYPLHLEPFYSSWVLISQNYPARKSELYLHGLVFVQQLEGHFGVQLEPKLPCRDTCPVINMRLAAGEALIFSTDLWTLSYDMKSTEEEVAAVATILEIDWRL